MSKVNSNFKAIEKANFAASIDEINKQQATPVFDGLLCEEPKDLIIRDLWELEPFGMFLFNSLKWEKIFYQFSPDIVAPPAPGIIKELGRGLKPKKEYQYAFSMVETLTYELMKIQVLKEVYTFGNEHFMIRIKRPYNRYPKYFYKETLNLWNGHERAEIVFFANSAAGAKGIKEWLDEALDYQSIQHWVNEFFDNECAFLAEQLMEDPDIEYVAKIQEYMERGFLMMNDEEPFDVSDKNENGDYHA